MVIIVVVFIYIHILVFPFVYQFNSRLGALKYESDEKGSWFYKRSILLGFIMSKKQERLRSVLLSEDRITNLKGFLT